MYHILVVDDDPMNTKLLTLLLEREGYAVTSLSSSDEVLTVINSNGFALIFIDVMLPGMQGLELCRRIRMASITPVILLSAGADARNKVMGLEAGADDYIAKPFDPAELLARARAILGRHVRMALGHPHVATRDIVLDPIHGKVTLNRSGKAVDLTRKESSLLHCLITNAGRDVTRATLLMRVWGETGPSTSNQVDVYIKRLRVKLEQDPSAPQLLLSVRGVGYKLQVGEAADVPRHAAR